jgi:hypothetical protein
MDQQARGIHSDVMPRRRAEWRPTNRNHTNPNLLVENRV